jgi:hypothetical protein
MKNKITILSTLFLVFLSSCNCVETHLTNDEKEWFSVYKKGQIIVFKSNLENLDTITVTEKIETHGNKDCNWFEIGTIQNHIINIDLQSKPCRNESYCVGGISISKDKVDEKCIPSFSVLGLTYSKIYQKSEPKKESIKLTTTNKTYSSAYYFEDGVNANNTGNNYLKSFYWDKKEGLIRYEGHDGEVFELLK